MTANLFATSTISVKLGSPKLLRTLRAKPPPAPAGLRPSEDQTSMRLAAQVLKLVFRSLPLIPEQVQVLGTHHSLFRSSFVKRRWKHALHIHHVGRPHDHRARWHQLLSSSCSAVADCVEPFRRNPQCVRPVERSKRSEVNRLAPDLIPRTSSRNHTFRSPGPPRRAFRSWSRQVRGWGRLRRWGIGGHAGAAGRTLSEAAANDSLMTVARAAPWRRPTRPAATAISRYADSEYLDAHDPR